MSPIQSTAQEGHSTSVTGVETPAQAVFIEICGISFGWNWGYEGTKNVCKSASQMQEGVTDTSSPTNALLQACLDNFTQQSLFQQSSHLSVGWQKLIVKLSNQFLHIRLPKDGIYFLSGIFCNSACTNLTAENI